MLPVAIIERAHITRIAVKYTPINGIDSDVCGIISFNAIIKTVNDKRIIIPKLK